MLVSVVNIAIMSVFVHVYENVNHAQKKGSKIHRVFEKIFTSEFSKQNQKYSHQMFINIVHFNVSNTASYLY